MRRTCTAQLLLSFVSPCLLGFVVCLLIVATCLRRLRAGAVRLQVRCAQALLLVVVSYFLLSFAGVVAAIASAAGDAMCSGHSLLASFYA